MKINLTLNQKVVLATIASVILPPLFVGFVSSYLFDNWLPGALISFLGAVYIIPNSVPAFTAWFSKTDTTPSSVISATGK